MLCIGKAFQGLRLNMDLLRPFKGSLVGFSREWAQVQVYIILSNMFENERKAKEIEVRYMVINALPLQYHHRTTHFQFSRGGLVHPVPNNGISTRERRRMDRQRKSGARREVLPGQFNVAEVPKE